MNNLSIKARLIMGFGLVVVLFLGYVGYSLYTLRNVESEVYDLAEERIPMMKEMNRWAMDAADVRRYSSMALIAPDKVAERRAQIKEKLAEIDKLFADYGKAIEERHYVRAEAKERDRKDFAELQRLWKIYHDGEAATMDLVERGQVQQAIANFMGKDRETFLAVNQQAQKMLKTNEDGMKVGTDRIESHISQSEKIAMGSAVVALIITVVSAWLLINSIESALEELIRVSEEMAKGDLTHKVQLEGSGAQISFAAPLTYNGTVRAGELVYNDMFTIYPYENQLFKLAMTGKEIKDYLEYSYDMWLAEPGSDHVLRIRAQDDPRNNQVRWSFVERPYNFDSAAGLVYTVDIRRPAGERVDIKSLADGTPFSADSTYSVAMTSYRANGGGGTIINGAGLSKAGIDGRILGRYPEIRELVYKYIKENMVLDESLLSGQPEIGKWEFIPAAEASDRIEDDMMLLFGK